MNKLEQWRIDKKMTYQQLAQRLGVEQPATVTRWCLHPDHQSYAPPSDQQKLHIQQMTLGAVLPNYWTDAKSGVSSAKTSRGVRNGRK